VAQPAPLACTAWKKSLVRTHPANQARRPRPRLYPRSPPLHIPTHPPVAAGRTSRPARSSRSAACSGVATDDRARRTAA
jgi:hypothetical protein